MSDDVQFINGLMFKPPVKKDGSPLPDWIKAKGSIKIQELIDTLNNLEGEWVNFDVKESKKGNWYAAIDTWQPTKDEEYDKGLDAARAAMAPDAKSDTSDIDDDDIPFD